MKKLLTASLITALLLTSVSANESRVYKPTPKSIVINDILKGPLGTYKFFHGMPTKETAKIAYDNLYLLRAIDVFLNFQSAVSIEAIKRGHEELAGKGSNKIIVFDDLMDSKPLFLTGNTDTVYALAMLDLQKDGPTVIEIPKGAGPGTLDDAFQRFVIDMGAPGPDRAKGGTYIILPPDYKGELKPTPNTLKDNHQATITLANGKKIKAWIAKSPSYVNWLILRGFLVDGKPDAASKMWREGLKVYPLSKALNPPKMVYVNGSNKTFNTILPTDMSFYSYLDAVIQKEPIEFIDPELRGQAAAIGIAKGEKFAPDAQQKKLLEQALAVGNATSRALAFRPKDPRAKIFPDREWYLAFVGKDNRWLGGDGKKGRDLDVRTAFFYIGTVNTPAMAIEIPGVGSNYGMAFTDKNGDILDGSKNYKLHLPANVPAKQFWSVVLYDTMTRSQIQTSQPFPSINSNRDKDKLLYNKDGSIDLYFGPKSPKGKEANWVQTVPNKAWFTVLRLYGPLQPWFDQTWKPGDIELVK